MRVAVLSDIHGNLLALEAVLADLEAAGGADTIVIAGDLCLDGPQPRETLARLRELGYPIVQGNTDRDLAMEPEATAGNDDAALLEWTRQQLSAEDLQFLRQLPFTHHITDPTGNSVLQIVHANPKNLDDQLQPYAPEATITPLLEDVAPEVQTLAFGHLHIPFVRTVDQLQLANIASVGLPKDGDRRANYGLFEWKAGRWVVEQRRVEYPVDAVVQQLHEAGPPDADTLIRTLLRARYPNMVAARGGRPIPTARRATKPATRRAAAPHAKKAQPAAEKRTPSDVAADPVNPPADLAPSATADVPAPPTPAVPPAVVADPVTVAAREPEVSPDSAVKPKSAKKRERKERQRRVVDTTPTLDGAGSFTAIVPSILEARLQAVLAQRQMVLADEDPEGVHDMRVATRRLRAALVAVEPFYDRKRYRRVVRRVRALARALGEVRDADVLLIYLRKREKAVAKDERAGIIGLSDAISTDRATAQDTLSTVIAEWADDSENVQIFRRFSVAPKTPGSKARKRDLVANVAARALTNDLETFVQESQVFDDEGSAAEAFHQLRIAGKKLRYTMELFLSVLDESAHDLLTALKSLQELLGELHDRDVLIDLLAWERARALEQQLHRLEFSTFNPGTREERLAEVRQLLTDADSFASTSIGIYGLLIDATMERDQLEVDLRALWASLQQEGFLDQLRELAAQLPLPEPVADEPAQETQAVADATTAGSVELTA